MGMAIKWVYGKLILMIGLAFILAWGCSSGVAPRVFVNPEADISYYEKIAVLPFKNLTRDPFAGHRLTRSFVTELIIAGRFEIVDPAEFDKALGRAGGGVDSDGNYDPVKLKTAAQALGVTGYVWGAVTEFNMGRSGNKEYPVIAFDAELTDVVTGGVVWRISMSEDGKGSLLGGGARTMGELTTVICREAVGQLKGEAF
jgi:TolB-like protein